MRETVKGESALFLSSFFIAVVAVMVKHVSYKIDSFFIAGVRFLIAIIAGLLLLKITKQPFAVNGKKDWLLRGIFGSLSMLLYYTAIEVTEPARATLLFNTYPVFVAFFGFFIFGEKLNKWQIMSSILCIGGVACVFYDGSRYSLTGDSIALAAGMLSGITVHYIKRSSEHNHPIVVYLAACFFGVLCLPFFVGEIFEVTLFSGLLLIGIGLLSLQGQILMTYGYRYVLAARGSIISYFSIPFTIALSYLIGEEFKFRFFIGIVLIFTGLFINRK